ncbi:MAG: alpha/beta hydrolase [Rhodospirillaceae bacterium]
MPTQNFILGKLAATECGVGRVALFLHGGLLNRSIFIDLMQELQQYRRCIAIDLPGFGGSQPLDGSPLTLPRLAEAVGLEIKDISPSCSIDVIGLSLGGGVAVELAHSFPEIIRTVCLIGVGGLSKRTAIASDDVRTKSIILEHDQNQFAKAFVSRMLTSEASQGVRQTVIDAVKSTSSETTTALMALLANYPDVIGRARSLKAPVLAICGESDEIVSYDDLVQAFSGAQNVIIRSIEKAGHLVPMEAPGTLAKNLSEFWLLATN